jgi:hypothetical protein
MTATADPAVSPGWQMSPAADFVAVDHDACETLAALLVRGAAVEAEYAGDDMLWTGRPASEAESDAAYLGPPSAAEPWTPRAVSTAHASCRLQLVAVADHMVSLAGVLRSLDDHGSITPLVIARVAIETASRAWWVMEPRIGGHRRVARACAE